MARFTNAALIAAASAAGFTAGSASAVTLINDTSFTPGDYFYVSTAPSPSLTAGADLVMDSATLVGNEGDQSGVYRYLPATQSIGVGHTIEMSFDLSLGSNFKDFHRAFAFGFFSLNGATGFTTDQTSLAWPDDDLSSIIARYPVFDDERADGRSTLDGRRADSPSGTPNPLSSLGMPIVLSGDQEQTNTYAMARTGEVYRLTLAMTRLPDYDAGSKGFRGQASVVASVTGDFGNGIETDTRDPVIVSENTFSNFNELASVDGILFGVTTDPGAGNEIDFTLDNVVVTYTIPEPASLSLLAAGGLLIARRR